MTSGKTGALRILVIDDAGAGELEPVVTAQGWQWTACRATYEALRRLRKPPPPDLLLLAPGNDWDAALELCRTVKLDLRTAFVPVVFVLPFDQSDRKVLAYEAGADDCLPLGVSPAEALIRLRKAVLAKQANDSLEDANAVITALANAVEGKDHYTCGHVERVGMYAVAVGRRLDLSPRELTALKVGGVVHDIGKIGIPDHILNKPGKLTDEEFAVVQRHPMIGYDILRPLRTFEDVAPIVRWHHEKPNGKGYPDRLAGDQIPLLARITAVADVFDALITDRPYRKGLEMAKCRAILQDGADKGDLDPALVSLFLEILSGGGLAQPQSAAA